MIRYPDALEGIEAGIGPAWLDKAQKRTLIFQSLGGYAEEYVDPQGVTTKLDPFWGDIKEIFVERQHGKCIYCETMLEWGENSGVQWDLEHFRPKRNVRQWPAKKSSLRTKYAQVPLGDPSTGYHLLAYSHRNYAAACKTCNSPYKSDYFPIAAARIQAGWDPSGYDLETAYLVYPLGSNDLDPADVITFDGAMAIPKHRPESDLMRWQRASVMIDFFGLNRDGLQRKRAHWLYHAVWPEVKLADYKDPEAIENLKLLRTEFSPYANCAACFIDQCASDRAAALESVAVFKQILKLSK